MYLWLVKDVPGLTEKSLWPLWLEDSLKETPAGPLTHVIGPSRTGEGHSERR